MSLLTRLRTILVKTESVYGTDPTPTGSANAILVRSLTLTPIDAQQVSRDLIRPYLGSSPILLAQVSAKVEFEVEFAGAGAAGAAPGWAPVLEACAFAQTLNTNSISITSSTGVATVTETSHGRASGDVVQISGASQSSYNVNAVITVVDANTYTYAVTGSPSSPATGSPVAGVSAAYEPVSANFPSVTIYVNVDGVLHTVTGARGTFEISMTVKQIPILKFTLTGIYNAPTDTAAPAVNYTAFQTPKIVNTQNTPAFSMFGFSGFLESMSLNLAGDVQYRTLVGEQEVLFLDRKPTGTFVIEAPTIASKDFFTIAEDGTTGVMSITHGAVGGNIVKLDAPNVSLANPNYSDSQGVQMLSIPFAAAPSSGNDELTVTVK